MAGGRGLGGVPLSDGSDVVLSDSDGRFELITTDTQDFLRMSVPAGYRIPQNDTGTARFYHPIQPGAGGEIEASSGSNPTNPSQSRP